jgi:hypothetical protein
VRAARPVKPPIAYEVYGERMTACSGPWDSLPARVGRPPLSVMHLLHVGYAPRRVCRRVVRDYRREARSRRTVGGA